MLKWTLLRMLLLLWMTRVTLQGGTGYQAQNQNAGGGGYPSNKGAGYGNGNSYNANAFKAPSNGGFSQNMGLPNGGIKGPTPGFGAQAEASNRQGFPQNIGHPNGGTKGPSAGYATQAGPSNGQKVKPNGYGAYPNGGPSQYTGAPTGGTKDYGAKAGPSTGQGAKLNGFSQHMGFPNGKTKGPNQGYSAKAGVSNAQAAKPNGYGGFPNGGVANQPNTGSSQFMGYPSEGIKGPRAGIGAKTGTSSGKGNKPNGYGGYPNGGAANQPNAGTSQYMGYSNGGIKGPQPGYGPKAGEASNVQGTKQNKGNGYPNGPGANQPNAGFSQYKGYPGAGMKGPQAGAKPNNGYSNGAAGNQQNRGSSQYKGFPSAGLKGPQAGYGAKAGVSNVEGAQPNTGYGRYPNSAGVNQPIAGSSQYKGYPSAGIKGPGNGGYPNGAGVNQQTTGFSQYKGYPTAGINGPQPAYSAKAGASNLQGDRPKNGYGGYPNGGGINQPNLGSSQYTGNSNGGIKGPKAGSSQYMGNPSAGMKGPQPGYGGYPSGGVANQHNKGYGGAALSGQGAKPRNGYGGYPNGGVANQLNKGYGAKAGAALSGQGAKPSNGYGGYSNRGAANQLNKGYGAKAGASDGQGSRSNNGYGGLGYMSKGPQKAANSGYMPLNTGLKGGSGGNGQKGEILNAEAASQAPVTQTKGFAPLTEQQPNTGTYPEQGTKQNQQFLPQTKGQVLPQSNFPSPMKPQFAPNSFLQGPQSYKPNKAYKPFQQNKGPKPGAPIISQSTPVPEPASFPQTSQGLPVEQEQVLSPEQLPLPDTPQGSTPMKGQAKIQQNPMWPQNMYPTAINPDLTGQEQLNGQMQGAIPSKSDCVPNGQWVKLPSPGSGYPNGKGRPKSQPGFGPRTGGYTSQGMNNGYKAGHGGYGSQLKNQGGDVSATMIGGGPTGMATKGKSQAKYGIGGLPFGGSPNGFQPNPFGQYGNNGQQYGQQTYNPKALGKYGNGGSPYNSQGLLPESSARSPDFVGLPSNNNQFAYDSERSQANYGQKGYQYGAQQQGLGPDLVPKKYGSPETLYNPETVSLGGDAKPSKYENPAVSYELLGPVTDGQSVEDNRSMEAIHQGPEIDGQKAVDNFGDGEIPPHPDLPEVNPQSSEHFDTGDYVEGKVQAEVVSFPAVPTVGPAVTSLDTTLSVDGSSVVPVSVPEASPALEEPISPIMPHSDLSIIQPATPQQIHIQQHLKLHIQPHADPETGKNSKYQLRGFFGNKYEG